MLVQDFGPVRLVMPNTDAAIVWNKYLRDRLAHDFGHPVDTHQSRAFAVSFAIGAMSAETDSEGNPQAWGALARGLSPVDSDQSKVAAAIVSAFNGLRELGAGYSEIADLAGEVEKWLTEQIVKPLEAGEKTAGFFARRKAG